jgi:glycosyltransferase involved in cell wall biosynthesis
VRPDKQLLLADLVRDHLTSLESFLEEVVEREEPLSSLEAALLLEAAGARLRPVEHALRTERSSPWQFATTFARRARRRAIAWLGPRIGHLDHYPPKPIELPAAYFEQLPPNPTPTISLVTPSFEQARFLERTLCSVLDQGYPALEYHVYDGGSTDDSVEILRRYTDRLDSWVTTPDNGQADAINRAFAKTSGELMGWINSDDLLLPGALAYVARFFDDHPEVDVVYGNRLLIDEEDGQIGAWILPRHDDHALTLADYVPQETLFWRRRVWDAAGGRLDPSFLYALDWDLLLRFRAAGAHIVHLPRYLGAFRVHAEQKTSASRMVGLEEMGRLRERIHGRPMTTEEVLRRLRPFFFRHRLIHVWCRILDRLPLRRKRFEPSVGLESPTAIEPRRRDVAPVEALQTAEVGRKADAASSSTPDAP